MHTFVIASLFIGVTVIPALAELEANDLGKDWLADARKDKNEDLEQAILKGIQLLKQLADNVDDTSKIRVYDVILKAVSITAYRVGFRCLRLILSCVLLLLNE